MKKILSITIIIIGVVWKIGYAQDDLPQRLARYMQAQADTNGFSGTVLVSRYDTVLLQQAYGLANREWHMPCTIDTRYSLASVSKQFTAAAILILAQQRRLSTEDRLSKFFPGFPSGDQITVQHLLTHMSGLPMDFDTLYLNRADLTPKMVMDYLARPKLLFAPGTGTAYSNTGYYLLARIIEKVSGQSYGAFLKAAIFDKLKMTHSGVISNDSIIPKLADRYVRTDKGFARNPYINWAFNIGHDGIYSTVGDLAKWDRALYDTVLLSQEIKQKMFTSYNDEHFGYGFVIDPFYNQSHQLIAHDGGFFGAMTSVNRFTKDRLFITVLSNNQSSSYLIAYALAAICFGKSVDLPYHHHAVTGNSALYPKFAGKYGNIEIIISQGKLYYNSTDLPLVPESDRKFYRSDDPERTVEFIKDGAGHYRSLWLSKAGVKELIQRVP
ncbi:serine hydrolase domain-containing protein [Mucilaginibacter segetis]|uniref:Beta-lactamase family protein n=1 Tax=Mucilaginibacter segetis TaxID=2793071 RepID=A0A934PTF0_9SPHI|nr:serine hydrolase domain-containing protein [Mucilaginibacter segetis]MBK0379212.1 beta-lactamase family protein [Mucilaginibacter segetis]